MILDRATQVLKQLERFQELRQEQRLADKLVGRAVDLESAVAVLDRPARQVGLLFERELLRESERPSDQIARIRSAAVKVREALVDDPDAINRPMSHLVKGIEKTTEALTETAESTWKQFVERRKPKVPEADLKRCEQFPSMRDTVDQIRRHSRTSDTPSPSSLDEWHAIETRWEALKALIAKLPKASENPEVNRFLDEVRKGGAPLSLFTESVRAYLTDNDKLDSFRIYPER